MRSSLSQALRVERDYCRSKGRFKCDSEGPPVSAQTVDTTATRHHWKQR